MKKLTSPWKIFIICLLLLLLGRYLILIAALLCGGGQKESFDFAPQSIAALLSKNPLMTVQLSAMAQSAVMLFLPLILALAYGTGRLKALPAVILAALYFVVTLFWVAVVTEPLKALFAGQSGAAANLVPLTVQKLFEGGTAVRAGTAELKFWLYSMGAAYAEALLTFAVSFLAVHIVKSNRFNTNCIQNNFKKAIIISGGAVILAVVLGNLGVFTAVSSKLAPKSDVWAQLFLGGSMLERNIFYATRIPIFVYGAVIFMFAAMTVSKKLTAKNALTLSAAVTVCLWISLFLCPAKDYAAKAEYLKMTVMSSSVPSPKLWCAVTCTLWAVLIWLSALVFSKLSKNKAE